MASKDPKRAGSRLLGLNDTVLDALVRHQVFLRRRAGGIRDQAVAILNATESKLREIILARKGGIGPTLTNRNLARADALIRDLLEVRVSAWDEVRPGWRRELRQIVTSEAAFLNAAYQTSSPVVLELVAPAIARIATKTTYDGKTTTQWLRNMQRNDLSLVNTSVRISIDRAESPKDTAIRMLGRRAVGGRDGTLQATRNHVASLAQTGVTAMSNQTKKAFARANDEIMVGEQFIAVLDGHTTPICRSLDTQIFPVGEGPTPPLHINCRSLRQPLIDGEVVGNRTATPLFEKRVLRDFTDEHNLPRVTKRADLPRGFKGQYDKFKQQRAFEVIGPNEPVTVSYGDWLRRQPAQFQNDVLGVSKGKLFRDGNLSLDRFVDRSGRELSLFEIAERDRASFVAAGLDPDDNLWETYFRAANPGGGN